MRYIALALSLLVGSWCTSNIKTAGESKKFVLEEPLEETKVITQEQKKIVPQIQEGYIETSPTIIAIGKESYVAQLHNQLEKDLFDYEKEVSVIREDADKLIINKLINNITLTAEEINRLALLGYVQELTEKEAKLFLSYYSTWKKSPQYHQELGKKLKYIDKKETKKINKKSNKETIIPIKTQLSENRFKNQENVKNNNKQFILEEPLVEKKLITQEHKLNEQERYIQTNPTIIGTGKETYVTQLHNLLAKDLSEQDKKQKIFRTTEDEATVSRLMNNKTLTPQDIKRLSLLGFAQKLKKQEAKAFFNYYKKSQENLNKLKNPNIIEQKEVKKISEDPKVKKQNNVTTNQGKQPEKILETKLPKKDTSKDSNKDNNLPPKHEETQSQYDAKKIADLDKQLAHLKQQIADLSDKGKSQNKPPRYDQSLLTHGELATFMEMLEDGREQVEDVIQSINEDVNNNVEISQQKISNLNNVFKKLVDLIRDQWIVWKVNFKKSNSLPLDYRNIEKLSFAPSTITQTVKRIEKILSKYDENTNKIQEVFDAMR